MTARAIAAAASLEAYRTRTCINLHNADDAADIIRGRLAANLAALSELEGAEAAFSYFQKLGALNFVPPEQQTIRLVVSNTAEIIRRHEVEGVSQ